MNIDEIRAEIPKAFGDSFGVTDRWIREHGGKKDIRSVGPLWKDSRIAARILVDWAHEEGKGNLSENWHAGYKRGYEEAAKDPKAWYVLDKKGEQVHIGDTVKDGDSTHVISCLGMNMAYSDDWCTLHHIDSTWEKVIPDTREKIKEEMASNFIYTRIGNEEERLILAEQFISRIEALEKQ